MCGRYTLRARPDQIAGRLHATYEARIAARVEERERYNVAPGQDVPLVMRRPGQGRELHLARWGFLPDYRLIQACISAG